jgi:hypothetical protein
MKKSMRMTSSAGFQKVPWRHKDSLKRWQTREGGGHQAAPFVFPRLNKPEAWPVTTSTLFAK